MGEKPRGPGARHEVGVRPALKGPAKLVQPFVKPMFETLGDPAAAGMKERLDSLSAGSTT